MREAAQTWVLAVLTTVYIVVIGLTFAKVTPRERMVHNTVVAADPGRNERSTPRSFILPSTPAVAENQESKRGVSVNGVDVGKCVAILLAAGNEIFTDDIEFNIPLKRAIFEFQERSGLEANGDLNQATARALGCDK